MPKSSLTILFIVVAAILCVGASFRMDFFRSFYFLYTFLANQRLVFCNFPLWLPLTEVSPQPIAIPGGNLPGDWQSAVGWGYFRFEPRTAGPATIEPPCLPLDLSVCRLNILMAATVQFFSPLGLQSGCSLGPCLPLQAF
jgi:hypothetical protein